MERPLRQLRRLAIPYPQKRLLEFELRQDMELGGDSEGDAEFSEQDLAELSEIHSTLLHRRLRRLPHKARMTVDFCSAFVPVVTLAIFIFKEDTMIDFFREGGVGMYAISFIGLFLFGNECLNVFRLLVAKDHSDKNLRLDTSSVWLGCLALMCIGLGWTFLGIYISAGAVAQTHAPYELLLLGAKESLTPTILGSLLSALILLAHYATRRALLHWRAPITD